MLIIKIIKIRQTLNSPLPLLLLILLNKAAAFEKRVRRKIQNIAPIIFGCVCWPALRKKSRVRSTRRCSLRASEQSSSSLTHSFNTRTKLTGTRLVAIWRWTRRAHHQVIFQMMVLPQNATYVQTNFISLFPKDTTVF